jgi:hypothetical protein
MQQTLVRLYTQLNATFKTALRNLCHIKQLGTTNNWLSNNGLEADISNNTLRHLAGMMQAHFR